MAATSPETFKCPKCEHENAGHALTCGKCDADLLVECLTLSCRGKNRLGSTHCSACGTNLVEYRLKRWRELDEMLESATALINDQEFGQALNLLNKVSAEQHEEFGKIHVEALELVRRITEEENLEKLSEEAAQRGDWQKAEEYLRVLQQAFPERKDISERVNALRQRSKEQFGEQQRQAQDLAIRANEELESGQFNEAIDAAYSSIALLPPNHSSVTELVELMARAADLNTRRVGRKLAGIGAVLGAIVVAVHFGLAPHRPSYSLAQTVSEVEQDIGENLKVSVPPDWVMPNYDKSAIDKFRNPPRVVENVAAGFLRN